MYRLGQKAILCSNHPLAKNEYEMHESKVTVPNKLDPEHPLIEEYLSCLRCFQLIRITPEIRIEIQAVQNDGLIDIPTKDILPKGELQSEHTNDRNTYRNNYSDKTPASWVS